MLMFSSILVLTLVFSGQARSRTDSQTPYIIGGSDSAAGEFPWQLAIEKNGQHLCGAVLFGDRTAVTAAHCIDQADPSTLRVKAGMLKRDVSDYDIMYVSSITINPMFNEGATVYFADLALVRFTQPADLTNPNIGVIPLARQGPGFIGKPCFVTGWGHYELNMDQNVHNHLQKAPGTVISGTDCTNLLSSIPGATIHPQYNICTHDGNTGACYGDEGGPLSCDDQGWKLAGVVSWQIVLIGQGCQPAYPTVYTSIMAFESWFIQQCGSPVYPYPNC